MDKQLTPLMKKILATTYTKQQLMRRIKTLKEFLNFLIFEKNNPKNPLEGAVDKDWVESLGKDFYSKFNSSNVETLTKAVEKISEQIKVVLLYLPFSVTEGNPNFDKVSQWFKKNLGELSIFEINFDPELIGGCALSLNGVYKDYSLRGKLSAQRNKVLASLSEFKRK
ncbi:MAG: hypothetical protein US86_C0004G0027 [Candidatus Daviesbacteria bacterium GW2011_GWA2_38_24]|uniref:F-type ATPase subunit delta n=1 Tax=Candidatus Daviesbacteria bacterium GW2011_GWA2_38_24 TaxID=1618422 RepID=A0A0G0LZB8_9BACT|nr:MAG: hypothetical protein US86_C0004G0027 [Candidatus Daviesbacteria bacterium GW2011_GWA2_38_24]KKQ78817.1 MAG: hypothetical protein UT01_C0059G0002 [Candidatus Daviesbacteria bacterium GW2011_GWA1_38_7]OGE23047.1 MAG: hypothetical protein A2688_03565 [Candidatus Daviesbacteria bacterium RIFCSPHIGHO2_01_FULL_38_8]